MRIGNEFVVVWYEPTLQIMIDYTQRFKGQNMEMNDSFKLFGAETLAEIDAKVLELGLTDPDMLVTPH